MPTLLAFKEIQEGECERRGFSIEVDSFSEFIELSVGSSKSTPALLSSLIPQRLASPSDVTSSSVSHASSTAVTAHHMCMHRVSVDSVAYGTLPSLAGVGVVFRPGIY